MKPLFEGITYSVCDICEKKRKWLVAVYKRGKSKLLLNTICNECMNEMSFALGKAMKSQNFKE